MDDEALSARPQLLLYLASGADVGRFSVGPALAAAAERAGLMFECYYDELRKGRHFGGGDPEAAPPGWPGGSLVAGGRHADQLLWLATRWQILALGDPACVLWPAVEAAGGETLARSTDPADLYAAAFERLGEAVPEDVLVLDGAPQGPAGLVVAPYLYPALLDGEPRLGIDASVGDAVRGRLESLGARRFVEAEIPTATSYCELTAVLAERHAGWGRGIMLGDPDLVASQLGRAARLRLLPLYARPQIDVIDRASELVRRAREPVYGRQYDDRDFFELARLGHGLQVVDPGPPFEASRALPSGIPAAQQPPEPDDEQLEAWADERRILVTLLLWCGMVRELDCLPRLVDLVAETGLAAGLVLTAETLELGGGSALPLLAVPRERGGVLGLLEPLLGSTGRGVAAEALLPPGTLEQSLSEAREAALARLAGLELRGWWPLLDSQLAPVRRRRAGLRSGRPVVFFSPRGVSQGVASSDVAPAAAQRDLRGLAGTVVRRFGLDRLLEERRPFDDRRPGVLDEGVAGAVQAAGFTYMWTKAGFGRPSVVRRSGEFVALPFTAGNWDGWSPFYTLRAPLDLERAERRLTRSGRPGWLAGTIDSPLWALSGEVLESGSTLYRIAKLAAAGGRSGRLLNVTPHVVARYARLLDERGLLT